MSKSGAPRGNHNATKLIRRKPITIRLPPELITEIDTLIGQRGRTAFIEQAIKARVEKLLLDSGK